MYKVKVNNDIQFEIETSQDQVSVNHEPILFDRVAIAEGKSHIIYQNKSYNIEVISLNEDNSSTIKVNGSIYNVTVENHFDQLLKQLGMDNLTSNKVLDVKSPMPGLVLNILVSEGDEVKKGDSLLVLEAMKMENNLKSPCDGVVKRIAVAKGDIVEKNAVLIQFS
ncbi:MAG: biotin/lipoyl-binding protein [Sphingobacteriaceae bacterium]|nr:biotin/lipoyl-binding protein [Sphingobacteriaceae bacterium]